MADNVLIVVSMLLACRTRPEQLGECRSIEALASSCVQLHCAACLTSQRVGAPKLTIYPIWNIM